MSARLTAARSARPHCRVLLQSVWRNSPYNWSDRHIHFRVGPPRCSGTNRVEGEPLASTACKTKRMSTSIQHMRLQNGGKRVGGGNAQRCIAHTAAFCTADSECIDTRDAEVASMSPHVVTLFTPSPLARAAHYTAVLPVSPPASPPVSVTFQRLK